MVKFNITPYKKIWKQICAELRKKRIGKLKIVKKTKKIIGKMSGYWKAILIGLPTFFIFYYAFGGYIVENIDISSEYTLPNDKTPLFETPNSMTYLIKREIDDKMWTPNLPVIFPAYVLDNMPSFQVGIIEALRDVSGVLRQFTRNTQKQTADIKEIYKLLSYSPHVWLMSRQNTLKLAPSSNSQYRKAAKKLRDYRRDGVFVANKSDLYIIIDGMEKKLYETAQKSELHQQEHSADFIDTKSDDVFYYNKGYTFALWQISKALGFDFKTVLIHENIYSEWTYFVSSLKKCTELSPLMVRNGSLSGQFSPNHLAVQNYYIMRALLALEQIENKLMRESYAD